MDDYTRYWQNILVVVPKFFLFFVNTSPSGEILYFRPYTKLKELVIEDGRDLYDQQGDVDMAMLMLT